MGIHEILGSGYSITAGLGKGPFTQRLEPVGELSVSGGEFRGIFAISTR